VVLIPVPFEATTSYGGGTEDGPSAILEASRQVDLFDIEVGRPYEGGIAMVEESSQIREWSKEGKASAQPILEAGGAHGDPGLTRLLGAVNALGEKLNARIELEAARWIEAGRIVGVVGGDHSTPFGSIAAHARKYPGMGILHLDAHADLRRAFEGFHWSHASIMDNVMERIPGVARLVQVGIRDLCEEEDQRIRSSHGRIVTFFDALLAAERLRGVPFGDQLKRIVDPLPQQVYLSFDIDGLDPTLCPHTGTPVPGGLSFHEASALIRAVVESGRVIVGFDLTEVAPDPEGGEWDGNVAARLLYKMIGWTLKSREGARPTARPG
jgi:agmatinase